MIILHNNPYKNIFILSGSIIANIIIYLVFLYFQQSLKEYYVDMSINYLLFNTSVTFGSILTALYLNNLFRKNNMNVYNFFILILIIQIIKRIISEKLYEVTKHTIFYNNIQHTFELLLLDIFNILFALFFTVILIKLFKV